MSIHISKLCLTPHLLRSVAACPALRNGMWVDLVLVQSTMVLLIMCNNSFFFFFLCCRKVRCISTSSPLCNVKFGRGKNKHKPKMIAEHFQPHMFPEYTSKKDKVRKIKWTESVLEPELAELRNKFPEFLPPDDIRYRTDLAVMLERQVSALMVVGDLSQL